MTSTEPAGANRDSPEPSPNTTRRSEEPEDKYVFTITNLSTCDNYATSGLPRRVARKDDGSMLPSVLVSTFKTFLGSESVRTWKTWAQTMTTTTTRTATCTSSMLQYLNLPLYRSFYRSAEEKGLLLTAYRAILKLIPKLKSILTYHADADAEYFSDVVNAVSNVHISYDAMMYVNNIQMQEGCNAARSEAIKRIKDNTIRYLTAGRTPIKVDALVEHKALRGLNDRNIGRLLIPAEELHEWDADPDAYVDHSRASVYSHILLRTRAAFLSGDFMIWGVDLPVFLYEDYTYNQEDPEEGLFRGAFLVCVSPDMFHHLTSVY